MFLRSTTKMSSFWAEHVLGENPLVELLFSQEAQLKGRFLKVELVLVGVAGNLCAFVVSDVRVESSHQHEGFVQELCNSVLVCLDADHTILGEGLARVSDQSNGSEHVADHDGLEDVQFKVPVTSAHRDGDVVSKYLTRYHGYGFALSGIYLAFENYVNSQVNLMLIL